MNAWTSIQIFQEVFIDDGIADVTTSIAKDFQPGEEIVFVTSSGNASQHNQVWHRSSNFSGPGKWLAYSGSTFQGRGKTTLSFGPSIFMFFDYGRLFLLFCFKMGSRNTKILNQCPQYFLRLGPRPGGLALATALALLVVFRPNLAN